MGTKLVLVLSLVLFSRKTDGRCANLLSDAETECATPLNLDASSVLEFYQSDSNDPRFGKYLDCVWLKWNYVDQDGVIQYDNLKNSDNLDWQISRICQDVVQYIVQLRIDFKEAAKYCAENRPSVENPLTVRRCIANNYKPTPVRYD